MRPARVVYNRGEKGEVNGVLVNCLCVGCGGFVGAVLRYLCNFVKFGAGTFPVATLGINVIGSFAIMFFTGVFAKDMPLDSHLLLFLRIGLCGGFTTFSTFSSETLGLLEGGETAMAFLYAALSLILCLAAAFFGQIAAGAMAVEA